MYQIPSISGVFRKKETIYVSTMSWTLHSVTLAGKGIKELRKTKTPRTMVWFIFWGFILLKKTKQNRRIVCGWGDNKRNVMLACKRGKPNLKRRSFWPQKFPNSVNLYISFIVYLMQNIELGFLLVTWPHVAVAAENYSIGKPWQNTR